jgi:hypothetical protein
VKTAVVPDPNRIFYEQPHLIDEALRKGVRDELLRRKPDDRVVIMRDGQVVWVRVDELLAE